MFNGVLMEYQKNPFYRCIYIVKDVQILLMDFSFFQIEFMSNEHKKEIQQNINV